MSKHVIRAAILSSYFDYNDYDNPIKTYLDDEDYIGLLPEYSKYLELRVKKNTANLYDNLFYNYNPKTLAYYSAGDRLIRTLPLNLTLNHHFVSYIVLDRKSEEHERVVYTFIDMFGFLGGLFDFMYFFGLISIQFFTENMYFNSVFSRLYQIRKQDIILQNETKTSSYIFSCNIQMKNSPIKSSNSSDIQSEINISRCINNDHSYDESSNFKKQKSTKGLSEA